VRHFISYGIIWNKEARDFLKREAMMTMDYYSDKTNSTSTQSDKPWIHVRAALIKKLWIGLAVFSTGGAWTAPSGQLQQTLANAAGA
jgi:hypothetical protein